MTLDPYYISNSITTILIVLDYPRCMKFVTSNQYHTQC